MSDVRDRVVVFEIIIETDLAEGMTELSRRIADPVRNPVPDIRSFDPLKAAAVTALGDRTVRHEIMLRGRGHRDPLRIRMLLFQ